MEETAKKSLKRTALNLLYPLVTVVVLVAIYAIAAAAVNESLILPTPAQVFSAMGELLVSAAFYRAFGFTLLRSAIAFVAAFVIGSALGVAAYFSRTADGFLKPLMTLLRAVPTVAVIFLLAIWVRQSAAPAIVAFTVITPLCFSSVKDALLSLDRGVLDMSRVYNVPKKRVITSYVLPAISPALIDGAAGNLSFAVKLTVAGEALAQTAVGIGGMLNIANMYLETARLMALTVLTVVICFVLEALILLCRLSVRKWL